MVEGFSIEGMRVWIRDEKISVECSGGLYEFSREEFNRRPREVMGRIFNIGRGVLS